MSAVPLGARAFILTARCSLSKESVGKPQVYRERGGHATLRPTATRRAAESTRSGRQQGMRHRRMDPRATMAGDRDITVVQTEPVRRFAIQDCIGAGDPHDAGLRRHLVAYSHASGSRRARAGDFIHRPYSERARVECWLWGVGWVSSAGEKRRTRARLLDRVFGEPERLIGRHAGLTTREFVKCPVDLYRRNAVQLRCVR
jgi:hypothetical protein